MSRAPYRVLWADWRGHHDWIGRRAVKRSGLHKPHRTKPPQRQSQDFFTREAAEAFVGELRGAIPEGELVVQLVELLDRSFPTPPQNQLLTGVPWPYDHCPDEAENDEEASTT